MAARIWKAEPEAALTWLQSWAREIAAADETVLAVVLFGSLARGDATAASDADVLILLEDSALTFEERLMFWKPVAPGIRVDVFPYTLSEARRAAVEGWGPVRSAAGEGRVLAARGETWHSLRDSVAKATGG